MREKPLDWEFFYTLLEVRVLTERYKRTYNRANHTAHWAAGHRSLKPSCLPTRPRACRTNITGGTNIGGRSSTHRIVKQTDGTKDDDCDPLKQKALPYCSHYTGTDTNCP